jgi:hypothetical protein
VEYLKARLREILIHFLRLRVDIRKVNADG